MKLSEKYKFGIVFYKIEESDFNVYHIIGIVKIPSEKEIHNFYKELKTDKEFGIQDISETLDHMILNMKTIEDLFLN